MNVLDRALVPQKVATSMPASAIGRLSARAGLMIDAIMRCQLSYLLVIQSLSTSIITSGALADKERHHWCGIIQRCGERFLKTSLHTKFGSFNSKKKEKNGITSGSRTKQDF